jgi:uncharacterized protein (TIGR00645 family)
MARALERFLLASRWLLAPFFLGLLVGLVALLVKAGQHALHIAQTLLTATESDVILNVLGLVDLTLGASLVLIIVFSGYENFITTIKSDGHADWPNWLTQIDFTGMKLKLMASIVSISAIQLLRVFMSAADRSDRELIGYAGIHLVFVVSGLLLAMTDKISDGHHAGDPASHEPPAH